MNDSCFAAITCCAYNYVGNTTFSVMGNEDIFSTNESIEHVVKDLFPESAAKLLSLDPHDELDGNSITSRGVKLD